MQQMAERQKNGDFAYKPDHSVNKDLCELFWIDRFPG
jgi:hypothetical protein